MVAVIEIPDSDRGSYFAEILHIVTTSDSKKEKHETIMPERVYQSIANISNTNGTGFTSNRFIIESTAKVKHYNITDSTS